MSNNSKLSKRIRKCYCKTFGSSVINSQLSPQNAKYSILIVFNKKNFAIFYSTPFNCSRSYNPYSWAANLKDFLAKNIFRCVPTFLFLKSKWSPFYCLALKLILFIKGKKECYDWEIVWESCHPYIQFYCLKAKGRFIRIHNTFACN